MRYLRLFAIQLRASLIFAMQYRADFFVDAAVEICWAAASLLPLLVVMRDGRHIGGFSYGQSLVVMGFFTLLKAIMDGAISPSIAAVVEHVRKGTLDFVLLKPADAQFLVSTTRFYPWRSLNVVTATAIFVYAFRWLGHGPRLEDILWGTLLLLDAVALLYALLVMTVSVAFYAVRVDNLTFLLGALFDAGRWPSRVFRGFAWFFFTFVFPLSLMTTYPAEALLGLLQPQDAAFATAYALAFMVMARLVWNRAISGYTSASS